MITKITDITKYQGLFDRAWDALNDKGAFTAEELEEYGNSKFTCLEQYFTKLKTLFELTNNYEYIMLPINEERLEINANTREISIPAGFKKLVGVQGDHLAETLIFSIDRFFDYIDLFPGAHDGMQIYIQWTDADGADKADPINMIHYDAENQKVLFGWPLSSKVTSAARNVPFSVRFFVKNEEEQITYSFNTKTHQITIAPALKATLSDIQVDETENYILNALCNSQNTNAPAAAVPAFNSEWGGIDLSATRELTDEASHILRVQAVATDTGYIDYLGWYKDGTTNEAKLTNGAAIIFDTTNDTERTGYNVYYEKPDPDKEEYIVYTAEDFPAASSGKVIYEKYYEYTLPSDASAIGTYRAKVQNRTGNNHSKDVWSTECTISGPEPISFTEELSEGVIIPEGTNGTILSVTVNKDDNTSLTYGWKFKGENDDTFNTLTSSPENSSSVNATTIGWYQVDVQGTRNHAPTNVLTSTICKVTNEPAIPEFNYPEGANDIGLEDYDSDDTYSFTVTTKPYSSELYSDEIIFEWFAQRADSGNDWIPLPPEDAEVLASCRVDAINTDSPASTLIVRGVDDHGPASAIVYKCEAKNKLNGKPSEKAEYLYTLTVQ